MAKNGMPESLKMVLMWGIGLGILALTLLILLVIFGNLSTNLGFTAGTAGYNDTEEVITDYTTSATNLSGQFGVVGTMIGIALLLTVLIGILVFAVRKLMGATTTGGTSVRSNGGFG